MKTLWDPHYLSTVDVVVEWKRWFHKVSQYDNVDTLNLAAVGKLWCALESVLLQNLLVPEHHQRDCIKAVQQSLTQTSEGKFLKCVH